MNMTCNHQEKMRLFAAVSQYGFAISDITLYLDTHPADQEALEYFHHMKHLYEKAVDEYETKYGPLRQVAECDHSYWQWVQSPWPWERGYY